MKLWKTCSVLFLLACIGTDCANAFQQAEIIGTSSFLSYHPDIRFRMDGMASYKAGQFDEALSRFRRAARFGDKPSQAMISEMYRLGQGVPADPVLAYAWMDLAAERGYTFLLVQRERLWAALDAGQRFAVGEIGTTLYEEYGDTVAKPRLEALLHRARLHVTGSHVGFVGNIQIDWPPGSDMQHVRTGEQFYAREFWRAEDYFAWQDKTWQSTGAGEVEVGPMEPVKPGATGP